MLNKLIILILSLHLRCLFQIRKAIRTRRQRNINQVQSNTAIEQANLMTVLLKCVLRIKFDIYVFMSMGKIK